MDPSLVLNLGVAGAFFVVFGGLAAWMIKRQFLENAKLISRLFEDQRADRASLLRVVEDSTRESTLLRGLIEQWVKTERASRSRKRETVQT